MSDWTATHAYSDKDWVETCDYCGCVFRMQSQLQDGHNESEEYYCPECGKEYRIRACITPTVTLISERTDGRTDSYKNN